MSDKTPNVNRLINTDLQEYFDRPEDQRPSNRYEQFVEIAEQLSPLHALIRAFGDLTYQVENGGFHQYFDNGCHSSEQNGWSRELSTTFDLFDFTIEQLAKFDKTVSSNDVAPVIELLNKVNDNFEIDEDRYETGYYWDEDLQEEVEEEVENEMYGQLTFSSRDALDKLSDKFYEISDQCWEVIEQEVIKQNL